MSSAAIVSGPSHVNQAWRRALELTASLSRYPQRLLPTVIEEWAGITPEAPALLSDQECMTYRALAERSRQCSRWALQQELGKGDAVCILMPNRPDYLAIALGIARIGCVSALLNTHLTGESLAHVINLAAPKHIVVVGELLEPLREALQLATVAPRIWVHGDNPSSFDDFDLQLGAPSWDELPIAERPPVTVSDYALYIYTSGTTGLPKAARVSHGRLMQWSHWFAGLLDTGPDDRMYNCLPMYHSVGGIVATGAVLARGGSAVISDHFSARRFWDEIVRWDCTLFQYIGELCRYLLHAPSTPAENAHHIRLCCGNGLRQEVWTAFQQRFRIPQILEFYAATEGNVSLFNVEGKPGAIGRIPSYLAHRFPASLVRFDFETEQPWRDERGFCVRVTPGEIGEAIGRIARRDSSSSPQQFEGYTSAEDTGKKILRDVFQLGDAWYRTGDLMQCDREGYVYFIDRVGDTFRWNGENVSTTEVANAISAFAGVRQTEVYGVHLPGAEGRACMAAIVWDGEPDLTGLHVSLSRSLPTYARPLFLRLRKELEVTGTFKQVKSALVRESYNPSAVGADLLYFYDRSNDVYVPVNVSVYSKLLRGDLRL